MGTSLGIFICCDGHEIVYSLDIGTIYIYNRDPGSGMINSNSSSGKDPACVTMKHDR